MLEPEHFGPGKIYAIATSKPDSLKVDGLYSHFTPKEEFLEKYKEIQLELSERSSAAQEAADYFNSAYYNQLKSFLSKLKKAAREENKSPMELLPFRDGDTLVSWERLGNSNYRATVAGLLKKIGYEVELK